jgi:hypothetical protein
MVRAPFEDLDFCRGGRGGYAMPPPFFRVSRPPRDDVGIDRDIPSDDVPPGPQVE